MFYGHGNTWFMDMELHGLSTLNYMVFGRSRDGPAGRSSTHVGVCWVMVMGSFA